MSSTTPKEFVDFEGLSYFWTRVQDVLQTTVDGHRPGTYRVPPGKQVSTILQEKGIVKVSFGEFGGPDKEAARESLGVLSADEVKVVQEAWTKSAPGSNYTVSRVSQDENGNVTVEFAEIPLASYDDEGNYSSGLMTGQDKEKLDGMEDITDRVSFIENHMLQTKPEGDNPGSGILKLFRGPLQGWTGASEP